MGTPGSLTVDSPPVWNRIGAFDLPLGLRREGIAKFYPAFLKDLLPLGIDIVRHEIVLPPDRVPAQDEAEDGVAVGAVGVRDSAFDL